MAEQYTVSLEMGHALRTFLYSQLFGTPAYPTKTFANQTVIVTGSNIGLGLEAARHFYRLDCAKLILAVRTISKGEAAKEDIVRSIKHRTDGAEAIEVWPLDLSSTASALTFADRIRADLERVDVLVENAGINNPNWIVHEGFESNVQVNVVNTLLIALIVLPKMIQTKQAFPESTPHLEIVSSEAHRVTPFKEANAPDLYAMLNDEKAAEMMGRYPITKLLEVLFVRELVSRLRSKNPSQAGAHPPVTITLVNPGLCKSALDRNFPSYLMVPLWIFRTLLARSTEVGSRTLVYGACAGPNSHGEFMSDGQNQDVERWIYSETGKQVQVKAFEQTMKVLETRRTGLGAALGLPA